MYKQVSISQTLLGPDPFNNPLKVVLEATLLLLYKNPIIVANVDWFKTKFNALIKIWQTWRQATPVDNVKYTVSDPFLIIALPTAV